MLGHGGRDADAFLDMALTEFRALGERWGISFALAELAHRVATRGEFAGARDYLDQAIEVVNEVGSLEEVVQFRSMQAKLFWLMGDAGSSTAALAEAQRYAEQAAWPNAHAELAMTKAELARWSGDVAEAYRQLEVATAILGADAERAAFRAGIENLLGYLTDDLEQARSHRVAALDAAEAAEQPTSIAQVLVGVADLALRGGDYGQAARLLAASAGVRGLMDRSQPDTTRIEQAARRRLGDAGFTEAMREGAQARWRELAETTLVGSPVPPVQDVQGP